MHAAILAILAAFCGQAPLPTIVDDVELVSVAHIPEGELIMFWGNCAGEWQRLDARWLDPAIQTRWDRDAWVLTWEDTADHCHRILRARQFVETWHDDGPRAKENQVVWWRKGCDPGLKQPPKLAEAPK